MTPQEKTVQRQRLAQEPFIPSDGAAEYRQAHAAEYSAYYLGEIEKHLGEITAQMKSETANSSRIALALQGLQNILPTLLKSR